MTANWIVETLARVSAQAGVLVLLVLLVQWIFRRQLTPHWRCALWLVVMARLVLPVSTSSRTSLFNLVPSWEWRSPPAVSDPAPSTFTVKPPTSPKAPNGERPVAENLPSDVPTVSSDPEPRLTSLEPTLSFPESSPRSPEVIVESRAAAPPSPWTRSHGLLGLWALGVLVFTSVVGIRSVRLLRSFAGLPAVTDPEVLAVQQDCARQLGVSEIIPIVESPALSSPALFGLFRPRLILPVGFLNHFSRQELRYVLLHELAHLRRHDLKWNWLVTGLLILHWFNPLLWLGLARWRTDRELACDALALEAAGEGRNREYGQTILHLLERGTPRTSAPGLVGILEDHRDLHLRIAMIASFNPSRRWGSWALGLLLLLAVVGLTDAQTLKPTTAPATRELRVGMDPPLSESESPDATLLSIQVLGPDGQPLPGSELEFPTIGLPTESPPRRLTDDQGRYLARLPAPPESLRKRLTYYSVQARHPNFATRSLVWTARDGDVLAGLEPEATLRLQRGITVGGRVQDERGQPLAGIEVLMTGSNYHGQQSPEEKRTSGEFSDVGFSHTPSAVAVTGVDGRWVFNQFPADLDQVSMVFKRPDGAQERLETVSRAELKAQTQIVSLKDGYVVRGIVVDELGQPVPNAVVREGYGWGNRAQTSEVTTDAQGRFERPHRAPRQWIYTATAPGRATASVVAQVGSDLPEVRLVLPPAKPWRLRIVDDQGRPVPDAWVQIDNFKTEAQVLDLNARANAEGYVIWTNAPTTQASLFVSSRKLDVNRKVEYQAGTSAQELVLSRRMAEKVLLTVKAFEIGSSQPVSVRAVLFEHESRGPFAPLAKPESSAFTVEIPRTNFAIGSYPSYRLLFVADGFETVSTGPFDFFLGDRSLEIAFQRTTGSSTISVQQPNGSPAPNVRWWATDATQLRSLLINGPGRYHGDQLVQGQADARGMIELPPLPTNAVVILAGPSGMLTASVQDLRRADPVKLLPYGTVEGQLLVRGQPRAGVSVALHSRIWSPYDSFHLGYSTITDAEGRFVFRQVPPGEYKLCRFIHSAKSSLPGRSLTESYQQPLTVLAGQTIQMTYASSGRLVTGQALAVRPEVEVDWEHDVHTLNLKLPADANVKVIEPDDFATQAAFTKARDESWATRGTHVIPPGARTYPLVMNVDGSFQVEDVPPGTYELRIQVTKSAVATPPYVNNPGDTLGSLVQEVVIPDGSGPLDLGVLKVDVAAATPAISKPPLVFQATTLAGDALTLSQFRGTNVLLVFWAAWSERSREQLATLQNLQDSLANEPRLAIVTVNLDDTSEKARSVVDAVQIPAIHSWLAPEALQKLTSELDLETLPSMYLVGTTGRIVGRDIDQDKLLPTLRRALIKP